MRRTEIFYNETSVMMHIHERGDYISDMLFNSKSFFEAGILHLLYLNRGILNPKQSSAIDIGANIGNHSRFFEEYLGFKSIYSIEPISKNFKLLLKNTTRSHCIKNAVSSNYQQVRMVSEVENMGNSRIILDTEEANIIEYVSTIRLDDLRIFDVSLIKIDVEGHEEQCLEGAMETIRRCKPVLWLESHTFEFIEKYSKILNYKVVWSDNYINYILYPPTDVIQIF